MANIPLIANPLLPPVPDEPTDFPPEYQKTADQVWQWMKDLSLQMKILFGSPQASNSAIIANLVQAGTVLPFAGVSGNIPSGYLACDGSVVSQVQYPSLWSAISSTWNTGGEGAGNFRLPDLRGRDVLGAGTGSGLTSRAVGQIGGEETHALTISELASHNHPISDPGHPHGITDPGHFHTESRANGASGEGVAGSNLGDATVVTIMNTTTNPTGISVNTALTGISTGTAGSGAGHNNIQPFGVLQWMIKF